MAAASERVAVGYITRTKGVRGEVKVEVLAHTPQRFNQIDQVVVQKEGFADRPLRIESWRLDPPGIRVKFSGFDNPEDAAQSLVKGYITVAADQRAQLPEDVYYIADLVGCQAVKQEDGQPIGQIVEVLNMPSTDVYVVRGGRREILVPAVGDYIVSVSIADRRVVIQGMESLLV